MDPQANQRYLNGVFNPAGSDITFPEQRKDITTWRPIKAAAWALVSTSVVLEISRFSLSFAPRNVLTEWISISFILPKALYLIACGLVWLAHMGLTTVERTVYSNALQSLWRYCAPPRLAFVAAHVAAGAMAARVWMGLSDPVLARTPDCSMLENGAGDDGVVVICVAARSAAVAWFGAVLGLVYAVTNLKLQVHVIAFPVLAQDRLTRFRSRLPASLGRAFSVATWTLVAVAVASAVIPRVVPAVVVSVIGWADFGLVAVAPTPAGADGVQFYVRLFLAGVACVVAWEFQRHIFEVILTEAFEFVGGTRTARSQNLISAVKSEGENVFIGHLAFRDLATLGRFDPYRRRLIFGDESGKSWEEITKRSLALITKLTQDLYVSTARERARVRIRQSLMPGLWVDIRIWARDKFWRTTPTTVSKPAPYGETRDYNEWKAMHHPSRTASHGKSLATIVKQYLREKPLFNWLLFEDGSSHVRGLFKDLQINLWAIEAVALLVSKSYTEDRTGSVQETIPDILSALLACLIEVDRHIQSPTLLNPALRGRLEGHQLVRPHSHVLVKTLHNAIYMIVTTFYESLSAFTFPPAYATKLQDFLDFAI